MAELELHGKRRGQSDIEGYESPDEYKEQDDRMVRDLMFSYTAAVEDPSGTTVLEPVDVRRNEILKTEEMGLLALKKGEDNHSFYTTAERQLIEAGQNPGSPVTLTEGGGPSEMGEHELADYIKGENPQGRALRPQEVVDLAGGDKELAHRLLMAENIASDGDPRKSVERGLTAVIERSDQ
jgi:hypothetical protein